MGCVFIARRVHPCGPDWQCRGRDGPAAQHWPGTLRLGRREGERGEARRVAEGAGSVGGGHLHHSSLHTRRYHTQFMRANNTFVVIVRDRGAFLCEQRVISAATSRRRRLPASPGDLFRRALSCSPGCLASPRLAAALLHTTLVGSDAEPHTRHVVRCRCSPPCIAAFPVLCLPRPSVSGS